MASGFVREASSFKNLSSRAEVLLQFWQRTQRSFGVLVFSPVAQEFLGCVLGANQYGLLMDSLLKVGGR